MASQAATSANAKHSSIVSDIRVIEFIYRIIRDAAHVANNEERKKKLPYYELPIGLSLPLPIPELRPIFTNYKKSPLYYDIDDITITGGSVLNIYDSKLTGFKDRRKDEFKSLKEELDRETTDIDMVWWPRERDMNSGYIYTADSRAIISFVQSFRNYLDQLFRIKPKPQIPGLSGIEIQYMFRQPSRVHSINIVFIINNIPHTIGDLSIHDNGGSQKYDSSGKKINQLVSMYDDPVYCSSVKGYEYSTTLTTLIEENKYPTPVYVPNLIWYVKQQLFAYGNFSINAKVNKMNIIQKRIEYLIKILRSYLRSHTNENKRNVAKLFGVDTNYETLVKYIVSLAGEKGITLKDKNIIKPSNLNKVDLVEEKEVIPENNNENIENNFRKLAEESTKILEEQANNDRVKNMIAYSKRILSSTNKGEVNKYMFLLEELTNMDPNSVYAIIKKYINIMVVFSNLKKGLTNSAIKEKYNNIYDHYAILGSYYIDELDKDPSNEKYKLELNKITMKLENEIVSIQNDINVLQKSASSANSSAASVSSSSVNSSTRRRRRKGKKKSNTIKKSNQNQ